MACRTCLRANFTRNELLHGYFLKDFVTASVNFNPVQDGSLKECNISINLI